MYKRQIEAILKIQPSTRKIFRGVFPIDRLPIRQPGAYVINLDKHDEPGSHWVVVIDDGKRVEYFDSYGLPPSLTSFLGDKAVYSTVSLQPLYSNACGFYCVYYIIQRSLGIAMKDILLLLSRIDSHYVVKNMLYTNFSSIFR